MQDHVCVIQLLNGCKLSYLIIAAEISSLLKVHRCNDLTIIAKIWLYLLWPPLFSFFFCFLFFFSFFSIYQNKVGLQSVLFTHTHTHARVNTLSGSLPVFIRCPTGYLLVACLHLSSASTSSLVQLLHTCFSCSIFILFLALLLLMFYLSISFCHSISL